MKFGVFDHLDDAGAPLGQLYSDRLRVAEAYDQAGIYGYHLAEHHATPLGCATSPGLFLAAMAQRTKTLRFGPMVYLLPFYHPLRLIEEICMLDQMSGGRLDLGVGRGVSPFELAHFGVELKEAQPMYLEAYEVVMKALSSRVLDFEGRYYRFSRVPVMLEPFQKPHPPLWYGLSNPQSVDWAAKTALNVVSNAAPEAVRRVTERYRAEWTRLGNDPKRLPFVGMTRHLVLAESDREALEAGRRSYRRWYESFAFLWREHKAPLPQTVTYTEDFDGVLENGQAIAGSPETVRKALLKQAAETGVNYFLLRFAFGDLSLAESARSVELFAKHVMPGFEASRAPAA